MAIVGLVALLGLCRWIGEREPEDTEPGAADGHEPAGAPEGTGGPDGAESAGEPADAEDGAEPVTSGGSAK